eukprot:TRINITY_DN2389_c1_g1_i4.p1 TRINITY_DN2389_c1_g1~~TRINITY_DN2389_c1_g1_i4.p1  ORF type:complete len:411 (-),score=84.59 TRINITY_DN2389_c1_g1_i4:197-1429(-)
MDTGPQENGAAAGPVPEPSKDVEIRPAGREVQLFNDQVFCELRAFAQVPTDFVNEGWSLESLQKGGGKGGSLMASIGDRYLVKEMSVGDHKTLLALAGSYGRHVRSGETLLCPIYLHFRDMKTGRYFFAMRNSVGSGPFIGLYDLKGCADDKTIERDGHKIQAVHKRIWNVGMWLSETSWTEERRRYFAGKQDARNFSLGLLAELHASVLQCIRRDTQWLASNNLMDYSLLVAVKEPIAQGTLASGGSGPSSLGHQHVMRRDVGSGGDIALHVSIIDFLQRWTTGKKIARCIKMCETNKATVPPSMYAERFCRHFEQRFTIATAPKVAPVVPVQCPPIGPHAGDFEEEGMPEDRINSRVNSRATENGLQTPCVSRPHYAAVDPISEEKPASPMPDLAERLAALPPRHLEL